MMELQVNPVEEFPPDPGTGERRWAAGFALFVILVTSVPYLLGYAVQGAEWRFTGFVIGVEDGNSYVAKILSGMAGAWTFRTPYTPYPQSGVIAFLPYLLLGKLAASPAAHEQLVALFHLYRAAGCFLAVLATYDLVSFFVSRMEWRRLATVLISLGGGLGWVLVLAGRGDWLGSIPLDFYSPETFGFLALFGLPHLALARAGFLWGLLAYLHAVRKTTPETVVERFTVRGAFRIAAFWLLIALAQPITGVIFGLVLALHLLSLGVGLLRYPQPGGWERWRKVLRLGMISAILPAGFLGYYFLAFSLDPFLKAWTGQNLILSPHPLHYVLAYGLVAPLAFLGGKRLVVQRLWEGWLLPAWTLALPFLAYAPVNLQRRLPEGIWAALVILAVVGLESTTMAKTAFKRAGLLPVVLLFPSTLILLVGSLAAAAQVGEPVFRPADEVAVFQFLEESAEPDEVVLSAFETGNALPAWAPLRVVIGHGPESANLADLRPRVASFFSSDAPDSARMELIREFDIQFVIWGPAERSLGDWDPEQAAFLNDAFQAGAYAVYEVEP